MFHFMRCQLFTNRPKCPKKEAPFYVWLYICRNMTIFTILSRQT